MYYYQASNSLESEFSTGTAISAASDSHSTGNQVHRSHSLTEIEMTKYRSISHDSDVHYDDDDYDFDFDEGVNHEEHPLAPSALPFSEFSSPLVKIQNKLHPKEISFIRSFLRCFLVVCTSLVAAFIPNIGLLVSLAGATSGTALALIFPPLLEVYISKQQHVVMSRPRALFCGISIVVGVLGAIVGTAISLRDIYVIANGIK